MVIRAQYTSEHGTYTDHTFVMEEVCYTPNSFHMRDQQGRVINIRCQNPSKAKAAYDHISSAMISGKQSIQINLCEYQE